MRDVFYCLIKASLAPLSICYSSRCEVPAAAHIYKGVRRRSPELAHDDPIRANHRPLCLQRDDVSRRAGEREEVVCRRPY